ncbi:MAG TPA: HAD hydrolase-like protein, partial [Balneolales bacterium]|nr:HAD hydrolase-like protein [Balneolales bacterium]
TKGVQHPEVDIRDIWKLVFESLLKSSLIDEKVTDQQLLETAIEYECRINPTWPMPDLGYMLNELTERNIKLGIVSNAQFYSPLLFEAYLEKDLLELGFPQDLLFWSYQQQIAKPSVDLYERIHNQLNEQYDIKPDEVLYIGNDMLNDMMPASRLGFKTALFAGDKRSLRLREDNEMCRDVKPDLVVDQLMQLVECLG